jgi:4-hydroxythreonine-4-phosphate dehydrogenase
MQQTKPVVALTLGDPAGIGPELIARLLDDPATCAAANVVLVGDAWLWQDGQAVAGCRAATEPVANFAAVRGRAGTARPAFLAMDTVRPNQTRRSQAQASGGASALRVLDACMDAALAREIDAICFAPLNKQALKLGGMRHEDELHHFAQHLGVTGYFCEFNTLDGLWTSRVSSHVPLREAPDLIDKRRIIAAAQLIHRALQASGVPAPRVAVAALNPHGGDGGTCGREEIDIIAPAVHELAAQGLDVRGPFPADTIFLKARAGELDAIVTMYHDQGQIALKLLGFSRGVTVQGGLPVPITTPAHGTAYDIAGQGRATVDAMANAFAIACRMGNTRIFVNSREG